MKKILAILFGLTMLSASAVTPFSFTFKMGDGTPNTNVALMTAWPVQNNTISVVGTNIVFGGSNITLLPDVTGNGTNQSYAGGYRVFFPNLNFGFFVNIPDVTNQLPLANYTTGNPVTLEPVDYYSIVSNWLKFGPATNTNPGIIAAIGFTPLSNTYVAILAAMGFTPQTNGYTGVPALGGAANIVTNGFILNIAYKTNGDPGSQLTNSPMGSTMSTTNGQSYVLSNLVWRLK